MTEAEKATTEAAENRRQTLKKLDRFFRADAACNYLASLGRCEICHGRGSQPDRVLIYGCAAPPATGNAKDQGLAASSRAARRSSK